METHCCVARAIQASAKAFLTLRSLFAKALEDLRVKRVSELTSKLGNPLSLEQCELLLADLCFTPLTEAEVQTEVLSLVDRQMNALGVPLLITFIQIINRKKTLLYTSLSRLAAGVLDRCESFDSFLDQMVAAMHGKADMIGSVFYLLNKYLSHLQENHKPDRIAALLRAVHAKSLICLANENSLKNAQRLIELMIREFLKTDDFEAVSSTLECIDEMNPKPQDICFNKMLDFICKQGYDSKYSELVLNSMIKNKVKASLVTFNTLLDLYVSHKNFGMASHLFESLLKVKDPVPDNFTFSIMINGVKHMKKPDVERATQLFEIYKERLPVELMIVNCLLDVYVSLGHTQKASLLVLEAAQVHGLQPDAVTYNTLIKDCARRGSLEDAEAYFSKLLVGGLTPSKVTFNTMMDICVKRGRLDQAMNYLRQMRDASIAPDHFSYSIIFNGIKNNVRDRAVYEQTFAHLGNLLSAGDFKPDEVFFNTMIDVSAKFEDTDRAVSIFKQMKQKLIRPSCITYGIMIKAFGRVKKVGKVFELFEELQASGLEPNDITYGCLIEALVSCNEVFEAEKVFKSLPKKNIKLNPVLFTTMVKGFSKQHQFASAVGLFEQVKRETEMKLNTVCYNCMIDVAIKQRDMALASRYYEEMRLLLLQPDLITYSIIIKGLCQERSVKQAVHMLRQMISSGISPDVPIFNSIIEASSDVYNYAHGFEVFSIMKASGVKPNLVTFGTLVKLHGFARTPHLSFTLLEELQQLGLKPSLILMTNVIHTAFANHRLELVDRALTIIRSNGIELDRLCLDKIVRGYQKHKEYKKADKFKKLLDAADSDRQPLASKHQASNFHHPKHPTKHSAFEPHTTTRQLKRFEDEEGSKENFSHINTNQQQTSPLEDPLKAKNNQDLHWQKQEEAPARPAASRRGIPSKPISSLR